MASPRHWLLGFLALCVFTPSLAATPSIPVLAVDIAPQPLKQALAAFGEQTHLQLFYLSAIVTSRSSKGARAGLPPGEALAALLEGTGLEFEWVNDRAVRIFAAREASSTASRRGEAVTGGRAGVSENPPRALPEVLVTANRRLEEASKVPINMVVWTEEAMEASGVKGMPQIAAFTPGVDYAFSPGVGSDVYTHVDIRGVTNRGGATVGVYMDEVPIPPARAATYLLSYPATFDLERVEILRGPQTVLLGDHAQSGAIRFLPNQPSLTTYTGQLRAEWGTTEYGGPSYEAGAAVGGPIVTDMLGFRVSGWFRQDGGYVDRTDPVTGVTLASNANQYMTKVARAALTFAPTPYIQLTPSLVYQSIQNRDSSTFDSTLSDPGRGIFRDPSNLPQPAEDKYYLAALKLAAHLGTADLSAYASYFSQSINLTVNGGQLTGLNEFGVRQRVYSGEVRMSSPDPDARLGWVAGAFGSSEHTHNPVWPPSGPNDDLVVDRSQLAAFGQIALRVTSQLTASLGVRIGHSDHDAVNEVQPLFHAAASDTWSAPKFGVSWQADDNNLLYLTIAKGYGSGGVYPLYPLAYPPDALWSYELGSKHELLDRRLRLEAGLFHIGWNNALPTSDIGPLTGNEHADIPGSAVSNGFDLATHALITDHTKATLELAYADAHFTRTVTIDGQLAVRSGVPLTVSPWNATASLEQEFLLRGNVTASVRLEDAFRAGSPRSSWQNDPASIYYNVPLNDPSANILNVRVAVHWSGFEVAAFLRNALNSHPLMYGVANGADNIGTSTQVITLVPRTLSTSGTWRF